MKKNEIFCGIHYEACHKNPCFIKKTEQYLPVSEEESLRTISLPFHENLSDMDVDKIIKTVLTLKRLQ